MKRMYSQEELKKIVGVEDGADGEKIVNDGLSVSPDGDVVVGKDLTVDGKIYDGEGEELKPIKLYKHVITLKNSTQPSDGTGTLKLFKLSKDSTPINDLAECLNLPVLVYSSSAGPGFGISPSSFAQGLLGTNVINFVGNPLAPQTGSVVFSAESVVIADVVTEI